MLDLAIQTAGRGLELLVGDEQGGGLGAGRVALARVVAPGLVAAGADRGDDPGHVVAN